MQEHKATIDFKHPSSLTLDPAIEQDLHIEASLEAPLPTSAPFFYAHVWISLPALSLKYEEARRGRYMEDI